MKRASFFGGPWGLRISLLLCVIGATSAIAIAQQVIATLPVGKYPEGVAVNPATNQTYITNVSGNSVTAIDGTTLNTTTIGVGLSPSFSGVNSVTSKIYVSNNGDNTVSVIDGTNNSVIKTILVGTAPSAAGVNPVTNKIYITNTSSSSVSVIDGKNDSVMTAVSVGSTPVFPGVNPVTNKIYVTNEKDGSVSVIDGTNDSVIKTVSVGGGPVYLAVNPVTNKIYVANDWDGSVSVIDGTNDAVIKTVSVGTYPYFPVVNPVTNKIYVPNGGSASVSVIDGTNDSVITTVSTGDRPWFVAVNPVTNKIYVPNEYSGNVSVIDGANDTVIATLTVGKYPFVVAVNPATNRVYVVNNGDNSVSVIAGANPSALQLVPVAPCRLVDTRHSGGGPIQGGTSQSFILPQLGNCSIPASTAAYALNVTAVPQGSLGYLTIWPTGEDQPNASILNSVDGRVKANAAIMPAGYQGAVSVFASNTTDLVLDINAYFTQSSHSGFDGPSKLAFYALTPCRVADTRGPKGALGGPSLSGGQERDFPVLASACNIPSNAQAYSLNFTVVPAGQLGYLTVWPMGQTRPGVSTLNDMTGTVVANAAIVPAGDKGEIMVFASNDTNLVIDVNGYFAPPDVGGLSLYPTAPCRVLDTRRHGGLFSGGAWVDVLESICTPSETAEAYVFNATVVPQASLGYLTLWPDGEPQPGVSTLNAIDGMVTSNLAIVPTNNGSIDAYASNLTQLILDISSYFAP